MRPLQRAVHRRHRRRRRLDRRPGKRLRDDVDAIRASKARGGKTRYCQKGIRISGISAHKMKHNGQYQEFSQPNFWDRLRRSIMVRRSPCAKCASRRRPPFLLPFVTPLSVLPRPLPFVTSLPILPATSHRHPTFPPPPHRPFLPCSPSSSPARPPLALFTLSWPLALSQAVFVLAWLRSPSPGAVRPRPLPRLAPLALVDAARPRLAPLALVFSRSPSPGAARHLPSSDVSRFGMGVLECIEACILLRSFKTKDPPMNVFILQRTPPLICGEAKCFVMPLA